MSKLKLYDETDGSREQLYKDLIESFNEFSAYPLVNDLKEQIDAHIQTHTEENFLLQTERFKKFSESFDKVLSEGGKNKPEDRANRDLLKYRYLSFIKSNLIQQLENNIKDQGGTRCAEQDVDKKLNDFASNEAKFNKFLDEEAKIYSSLTFVDENIKNIKQLNEISLKSFQNLAKLFPSKENNNLLNQMNSLHKFQETKDKNQVLNLENEIGKRSWKDFFSDLVRVINSIASSVVSIFPARKQEEYKGSFFDDNIVPPSPIKSAPSSPPIPDRAPVEELNIPEHSPPPVPDKATTTFAEKEKEKKEIGVVRRRV